LIFSNKKKVQNFIVNKKVDRAIINNKIVVNLINGELELDTSKKLSQYRNCKFHLSDSDKLICRRSGNLYQISLSDLSIKKLIKISKYRSISLGQERIYAIDKTENISLLSISYEGEKTVIANKDITIDSGNDDKNEDILISELRPKLLSGQTVFIDKNKNYYLLNNNQRLVYLGSDLESLSWLSDSEIIITTSLNELILVSNPLDPVRRKRVVLDRISEKIGQVEMIGEDYLAFLGSNKLYISGLKTDQMIDLGVSGIKNFSVVNKNQLLIWQNNLDLSLVNISQ
jgi:hypothetical protein